MGGKTSADRLSVIKVLPDGTGVEVILEEQTDKSLKQKFYSVSNIQPATKGRIENIKTVNKAGGGANIATRAFTLGKNPTVAEPATTYGKSSLSNNADEVNDNVGEGTDFDINESPFEGSFQRAWHGSPVLEGRNFGGW